MHDGAVPAPSPIEAAPPEPEVALPWLIRLRWVAMSGQTLTVLGCEAFLHVDLPLGPLGAVIATTALTNLGLHLWQARAGAGLPRLAPAILTLDTLLLTGLLYWSGGPQNPFTLLYVVHVALAAVALRPVWAWWMVLLSALCYALLLGAHEPLRFVEGSYERTLYVQGVAAAVLLVAAVTAYYTAGLAQSLRRREQELGSAEARAAQSEWLASLAALAAGTAHELGTPLGTIAVVSKELERAAARDGNGGALLEDARLIRAEVDRCRRILDRLGTLDQEGLGPARAPQSLEKLLGNLRGDLPREFAVRLRVEMAAGVAEEPVHPHAGHALLPLLRNAFDASSPTASVVLRVEREAADWTFRVEDEGVGMPAEVRARALEPFFTTKEYGRGMGLGLYLARLVAERLGGRLELDSRPGAGTQARLALPAPEDADG